MLERAVADSVQKRVRQTVRDGANEAASQVMGDTSAARCFCRPAREVFCDGVVAMASQCNMAFPMLGL